MGAVAHFTALLLLVFAVHAARLKLENLVTPCHADDPEINECVRLAMLKAIPKMAKGVRELGLLPYDPLELPRLVMNQQSNGVVGLTLTFFNSKHYGVSQLMPHSVKVVPERMYFEINSTLASYRISGNYDVSGRILLLPLSGSGPSNFTVKDISLQWVFYGKPETRNNGKVYARLTNSKILFDASTSSGTIRLQGLFNGDKLLGDNMNRVLNENFDEVLREVLPALQDSFSELYLRIIEPLFASVPYEQIFPGVDLSKVRAGPAE